MTTPKPYPEQETTPATESDKVAEALSPYISRTETRRGIPPKKVELPLIAGLSASEEVWRFAQENALVPHIETTVQLAREAFKDIREIKLSYAPDPEIPHWEAIVIDLYVTGTMGELQRAYDNYTRTFIVTIPHELHHKIGLLIWPNLIE
ncbi:MAG: hypothetical protein ONB44_08910 [candidate division KSB1 bacterium]|nr:hypothetical protein [candidate division KSB1 bacterium]MDZ7302251.1 hypothetical protein [candidate division KSB1 bacterium]MDZ7311357.1 hypothetical protein [candidate division KSB1 bacterium]